MPLMTTHTMRHVESSAIVDFAAIYDDDVEMVSVAAPQDATVRGAVATLLSEPDLQAQWYQGRGGVFDKEGLGYSGALADALGVLHDDIDLPVELLKELLGCSSCGVRIKVLEGPMCPRFHVDKVPCRMLMTYAGPGTEWIANAEVDPRNFATGDADPLLPGSCIQQIPEGVWSLLKGGNWNETFAGVVHRSPAGEKPRLLVSLDPIFSH